jgi:hypothetical protein
METNFPNYLTKAMLRPFGQLLEAYEAFGRFWRVEMLRQSQV